MKQSALKQRAKKRKKDCPEGHSMQPTGKKDPKTGKDLMKCQLNVRGKEGPNKDKEDLYDLNKWQAYEEENPRAFTGMYQFWCQKIS